MMMLSFALPSLLLLSLAASLADNAVIMHRKRPSCHEFKAKVIVCQRRGLLNESAHTHTLFHLALRGGRTRRDGGEGAGDEMEWVQGSSSAEPDYKELPAKPNFHKKEGKVRVPRKPEVHAALKRGIGKVGKGHYNVYSKRPQLFMPEGFSEDEDEAGGGGGAEEGEGAEEEEMSFGARERALKEDVQELRGSTGDSIGAVGGISGANIEEDKWLELIRRAEELQGQASILRRREEAQVQASDGAQVTRAAAAIPRPKKTPPHDVRKFNKTSPTAGITCSPMQRKALNMLLPRCGIEFQSVAAALQHGKQSLLTGNLTAARDAYLFAWLADLNNTDVTCCLGTILHLEGIPEASLAVYESILAYDQSCPRLLCAYANLLRDSRIKCSKQHMTEEEEDIRRELEQAAIDCAGQCYRAALALAGEDSSTLSNYAIHLAGRVHNHSEAIDVFKRAMASEPGCARALHNFGAYMAEQALEARQDLDELIQMNQTLVENIEMVRPGYFVGGTGKRLPIVNHTGLMREGDMARAEVQGEIRETEVRLQKLLEDGRNALAEAAALDSTDGLSLTAHAALLMHAVKDLDGAEAMLQKALETSPQCGEALYQYAELLRLRGERNAAGALYARALDVEPSNPKFLLAYAVHLKDIGKRNEGLEYLHSARAHCEGTSVENAVAEVAVMY